MDPSAEDAVFKKAILVPDGYFHQFLNFSLPFYNLGLNLQKIPPV